MIRTLLIDDEIHFIETLKALCGTVADIEIVGEARSVESGVMAIQQLRPDVVFLDIEMEDGTGFDLLRQLPNIDFHTIFVTAHDQYAIDAFKVSAQDYLLKPVISTDLYEAIDRVREKILKGRFSTQMSTFLNNMGDVLHQPKKIVLKEAEAMHVVRLDEILYCFAEGSYTTFLLTGERKITVSRNLKEYEDQLTPNNFLRVHRAYLVNLDKIKKFDKTDGGTLVLQGDVSLPVSVRKKEALIRAISQTNA